VRAVRDRLRAVYGIPRMAPHGDPLAELVLTVLSQSTNDRNRDVAYLRLRTRLTSWEAVRDAPLAAVEEAIRPGGISKVKSERIQRILRAIDEDRGLSLDWLPSVALEEARDYLTSLPGVGRKTAACVRAAASRRALRGAARPDARANPAGRGARAARQSPAPRAPHLPRAQTRLSRMRFGTHVPQLALFLTLPLD
jgi:endonuclease III